MSGELHTAGVIATFNQGAFIAEAVLSMVGQVDELVVVDDGSSDETAAVLGNLPYANLRVLHNARQCGVSHSFNTAVEATTADILFIQGGDDRSAPDRVARQLQSFEDGETILSASVPFVVNEAGSSLPAWAASEFLPGNESFDNLVQLFSVGNMICAPSVAVRRFDYLKHGGFHIGLKHLQDYHLWLKLAEWGQFDVLAEPVVSYRKHSSNLSRDYLGIDSPVLRRKRAELDFILTDFLGSATSRSLDRLAAASGVDLTAFQGLDRAEQVAVLELSHHDRLLMRHGLAFVFRKLGEDRGLEALERMGLSPADLDGLATRADHNNGEDVARALAVRAHHDALASQRTTRRKKNTP